MKVILSVLAVYFSSVASAATMDTLFQKYTETAENQALHQDITWKRLMYAEGGKQSEVQYSGYFLAPNGQHDLKQELKANIQALFQVADPNQSIRCRFPARSQWLIEKLNIPSMDLPVVSCPELEDWLGKINPHKASLIYATDFMGNPSSMFGHTLLRLDPKDQKQLNLVSYAVNYAAMVESGDDLAFAWKGLTGQYAGEYSLMPYYRKVKEYGDFESRDLWEYELDLNPEETLFLVQHIWELKNVHFPYYFIGDNCAYRLLGLIDLVKPQSNLKAQFKFSAIPIETIKAVDQEGLIRQKTYRPALETQLVAQARQHGKKLAKVAHQVAFTESHPVSTLLNAYNEVDQSKILEMAYDDLYLQLIARKADEQFAQARLRELLTLRSQLKIEKQRQEPIAPKVDPTQSHDARYLSVSAGEVQGQSFVEIGHRQAYHDLLDPQGGFRLGTQLKFGDFALQYRDEHLKLEHFDLVTVNSYNPITPFKMPLSWGFNLAWQQEALDQDGQFSADEQHGVFNINSQLGYTIADQARQHLCFAQLQTQLQAGKALDDGWRVGLGPIVGCQNVWSDRINSTVGVSLPYWQDLQQWQLKVNSNFQYVLNRQNTLRLGWEYEQQEGKNWDKWKLSYIRFF